MTITAWGVVTFLLLPAALVCRAVTAWGAVRMLQGKSYRMGVTSGLLAMIPCSPLWLLSLPLGIWSLVVLSKPEVKRDFAKLNERLAASEADAGPSATHESGTPAQDAVQVADKNTAND